MQPLGFLNHLCALARRLPPASCVGERCIVDGEPFQVVEVKTRITWAWCGPDWTPTGFFFRSRP